MSIFIPEALQDLAIDCGFSRTEPPFLMRDLNGNPFLVAPNQRITLDEIIDWLDGEEYFVEVKKYNLPHEGWCYDLCYKTSVGWKFSIDDDEPKEEYGTRWSAYYAGIERALRYYVIENNI